MDAAKQRIALLGSTGSIGEQTLDTVREMSDWFEITTLTAHNNWQRLAAQAIEFEPDSVVIANKEHYAALKEALSDYPIKIYAGNEALCQVVRGEGVDMVINALVGYSGLMPTISTLEAGKKLALANKESLVVAGELVMRLAHQNNVPLIPIDSEHSAIFQCLVGEVSPIHKILLTASGGPFLHTNDLSCVTVEQALNHPNWSMGRKITVDSATMLNKGFEVIEAKWLFGVAPAQIEVLIHPQSAVHSMVEFADGAIKAQIGTADMHLPIRYAMTFPMRIASSQPRFDFCSMTQFNFMQPDPARFPALRLAFESLKKGGNSCCTLNAANEIAVEAFLNREIGFMQIPQLLEQTLSLATHVDNPTLDQYAQSNTAAREITTELIKQIKH